jgi:flagellar hook capping protein FlgD
MRRGFALLAVLFVFATANVYAVDTGVEALQQQSELNAFDKITKEKVSFRRDDPDTQYFGGDDGNGVAFNGGIWDFDTIVTDPLQGFTAIDLTANLGDWFSRVVASDFNDDPCTPMFAAQTGQLWAGIHQEEANGYDFIAGMGYGDNFCQSAYSPMFDITLASDAVDITFTYFNDTEVDYDYSYVYIRCFDAAGDPLQADHATHQVDLLTGIIGSYTAPVTYIGHVDAGTLPSGTEKVKLELRVVADGGYSDEDGNWDTTCGPFAADNVIFTVGAVSDTYDFEVDEEGWTFGRCPGVGSFIGIVEPGTYENWLIEVGLLCDCALNGDALEMVDEVSSPFSPPGHPVGQHEQIQSGIVPRGGFQPPAYNTVQVDYVAYMFMTVDRGTFYRPGYRYYPFTTEVNPLPHWSGRFGQNTHWYAGAEAGCGDNAYSLTTLNGQAGDPLPVAWDSLMFTFDIYCSAAAFGLDPTPDEGNTLGSPVIDDMVISLTGTLNAPPLSFDANGLQFMDGFGQNFPTYLEPSDRGNANVAADLSLYNNDEENDWLADTTAIVGPAVSAADPLTQYDVAMCFRVTHKGPRQDMVPEYHAWKARLTSDPELDYVCVQMDSVEIGTGPQAHRYVSYFHESEPGFDAGAGDLAEANEILPDGVFTPGTRIQYYFTGTWANIPDGDITEYGTWEFEILPRMRASMDSDYGVEWPSFLYVDAFNRGVEFFVNPTLEQLGIEADKYDYLDCSSNWHAPMKRSLRPTGPFNPGGYGNNGLTVEQMLGYRMIFVNVGNFTTGCMEKDDWDLFSGWLNATECDLPSIRRGIIFDGNEVAQVMLQTDHQPQGGDFLNQTMGATQVAASYRDYVDDQEFCVYLSGLGAAFDPAADVSVYGNGCPTVTPFNVLGVQGGVDGALGNLAFYNDGVGETEFAQVVRTNTTYPYNWKSIVNGFSVHQLSWVGCAGGECETDSSCIVNGAANMLLPSIDWILDGSDPFDVWLYPCTDTAVDDDQIQHSDLKVNFLRGASPNPFRNTATIRFSLAQAGEVDFSIFDVSGRLVKSLGEDMFEAGDQSIAWDGTDNSGNRVGGGIFWMQMNTQDGFSSGKKMIVLR